MRCDTRMIWATVIVLFMYMPTAHGQATPPPTTQPSVQKILEDLGRIDVKELNTAMAGLKSRHGQANGEVAKLREQLNQKEAEVAQLALQLRLLEAMIQVRQAQPVAAKPPASTQPAAAPAQKAAMAKPAVAKPTAAAPPPAKMPKESPAKKEEKPAEIVINYKDHILPIINDKCAGCHNPDKAKGGLVLVNYGEMMEGGSSGTVIEPGSPDTSRLFRLISHAEEPFMPPKQSKLPDETIEMCQKWIAAGARVDRNAKQQAQKAAVSATPIVVEVDTDIAPKPMDLPLGPVSPQIHPRPATAIATSSVADVLAVAGNGQVLYYDTQSHERLGVLDFPEGEIEYLAFSGDGTWLIAAGGIAGKSGTVVGWDVETGERMGTFDKHYDNVLAADISPDTGMVAVGGSNAKVRVFDAYGGGQLCEITAHNDWVGSIAFSPDGMLLATADRAGGMFLWEPDTGRQVAPLRAHTSAVNGLAFAPKGNVLASAGEDKTVRLWNTESGKQIKQWTAHTAPCLDVAFSPDGRLATSGVDGRIRLWDTTGKHLKDYATQPDWVYSVRFTADGKTLIAGCFGGAIPFFGVDDGKELARLTTAPKTEPPAGQPMASTVR